MASFGMILTIALMATFALTGAYGSLITAYLHGFLDAIKLCVRDPSPGACILDMSHSPYSSPKPYTGVPFLDAEIALLLEFFAQGVKSGAGTKIDLDAVLAFTYMCAQFGGAWYLMALEGLRRSSAGTVLRRTGIFGITFQAVTINLVAPVYFILQLLIDPASTSSNPTAILADPADLELLPLSTFISFVLPSIGLFLPLLNILDKESNYLAIALWQPFPLYQTVVHPILRAVCGGGSAGANGPARQKAALDRAYRFILGLVMAVHLLVVGAIAASFVLDAAPTTSPKEILALTSLSDPPTLALFAPPVSALDSRAIVSSFLRWDVYGTCATLAVWAGYQWQTVQDSSSKLAVLVFKILFWAVLGGPLAPAIVLLWERDGEALNRAYQSKRTGKKIQ